MRSRPHRALALLLLVVPAPTSALQLRWSTGADTLSFSAATQGVLVLEADSAGLRLPDAWQLLWVADSSGLRVLGQGTTTACPADRAWVSSVAAPVTRADSAAHQVTARFCSAIAGDLQSAEYVLDLPGGGRGKLKVVALDPRDPDSMAVLESNEVTFNGGWDGEYPPAVLRASSTHQTAELQVRLVGTGLATVQSVRVGADDDLWSVPLTITARTANSLQASADVHAALPAAVVQASGVEQLSALAPVPAESPPLTQMLTAGPDTILFRDPNPRVYPKDFAFFFNSVPDPLNPTGAWKGIFHQFYIRNLTPSGADSIIGHAWTDSLGKARQVDTLAFRPSGSGWDAAKVWAPSIQQVGNLYAMFYTGVDATGDQSIGLATTPMLGMSNISWTRSSTPVFTAQDAGLWADTLATHYGGAIQFRDPFIIPDPDQVQWPGRFLMLVVGEERERAPRLTVGLARNEPGLLSAWRDLNNYEATDSSHLHFPGAVESPMVIRDSLSGAWRMLLADSNYDNLGHNSTIFLTGIPGDSLTNTAASAWPGRDTLFHYVGDDGDVIGWQACEHLQIGQVHFFAGYEGNGIGITRMHWDTLTQRFFIVPPSVADAQHGAHVSGVRFSRLSAPAGRPPVRYALDSERAIPARVVVYDLSGRRVKTLFARDSFRGHAEFAWDGHDESGALVRPGIYFSRLTSRAEAQVLRVAMLR